MPTEPLGTLEETAAAMAAESQAPTTDEPLETPGEGSPEETPEETGEETVSPDIPEEWSGRTNIEAYDRVHGTKVGDTYKTDADFFAAQRNAQIRLSQRDEDAIVGKWFQENREQIQAAINQATALQQQPLPADDKPLTFDEYQRMAAYRGDDGNWNLPAGSPPNLLQRLTEAESKVKRTVFDLAMNPDAVLKDPLDKFRKDILGESNQLIQKQTSEQKASSELEAVLTENAPWFCVNGDFSQMTEAGRQVEQAYNDLRSNIPPRERFIRAMKFAGIVKPAGAKAKPVPNGAVRKPAAAPGSASPTKDLQTLIDESVARGDPISKTLEIVAKERAGKELG